MCGIAGIVSPYSSFIQQHRLQAMATALQHRGPDGEGLWINDAQTLGFAHRRLSVIDLSAAAAQPMHYLHYTVMLNGEIYNYIELKKELQNNGYVFTTSSDTEVIPAAYDFWGIDFLNRVDGMFALSVYNRQTKELLLARDRFGEKPLYYYAAYTQRGKFDQLLFASEMKALWKAGVPRQLNATMMLNYITLGYVQNPQKKTETFFINILSLPPGHYLTIQPEPGRVQMKRWYKPDFANTQPFNVKEEDTINQFRNLLIGSVQRRLRSDVAAGASISGGLDSSAILAIALQQQKNRVPFKTFSAVFPGFEKDESPYILSLLQYLRVPSAPQKNSTPFFISPTADDFSKHWQQLMYHQEEPLQSSSVFTQFMIYRLAKEQDVTVILDGQGADEILGGYTKYSQWYLQQLVRNDYSLFQKEKQLLQQNAFTEHWGWRNYAAAYFPEKTAEQLQKKAIRQQNSHEAINKDFLLKYQNTDSLHKPVVKQLEDILYYNSFQFGLEELLRYADRNAMAHAREVRLPFLNHTLVEFIFSLPASYKINHGFTKWILRQSMQNLLPPSIAWRTGKIGYEPPQKQWMQDAWFKDRIYESRNKLVQQHVLDSSISKQPLQPMSAHDANNNDWRYLCAANLFEPNP